MNLSEYLPATWDVEAVEAIVFGILIWIPILGLIAWLKKKGYAEDYDPPAKIWYPSDLDIDNPYHLGRTSMSDD